MRKIFSGLLAMVVFTMALSAEVLEPIDEPDQGKTITPQAECPCPNHGVIEGQMEDPAGDSNAEKTDNSEVSDKKELKQRFFAFDIVGGMPFNHSEESTVFSYGLLGSWVGEVRGLQLSTLVSSSAGDVKGVQVAGLVNTAYGTVEGVQLATVVNYAKKIKGVQIGLINYSEEIDGLAIGLVSVSKNGVGALALSYDSVDNLRLSVKYGTPFTYTSLYAEMPRNDILQNLSSLIVGANLGFRIGQKDARNCGLYLDTEIGVKYLFGETLDLFNESNTLVSFSTNRLALDGQIMLGWNIYQHFGIFAGFGASATWQNSLNPAFAGTWDGELSLRGIQIPYSTRWFFGITL